MPDKTDYIKAFTEAIEKADLENETVVRNLKNALVMASARYEGYICANVEFKHTAVGSAVFKYVSNPVFNFSAGDYRLKPEPQYKPFDVESFKPYRDCWFQSINDGMNFKVIAFDEKQLAGYSIEDGELFRWDWDDFMYLFTLDGKPAGVEV